MQGVALCTGCCREVQGQEHRVATYLFPALAAAILLNLPRFLELRTIQHCVDYTACNCSIVTK